MTVSILFVCMGNICRSPLAETALRQACANAGISMIIDSAGTYDLHAGQPPDERARAVAAKNGAPIDHLRARGVRAADFRDFDHVIALDADNLRNLEAMQPKDATASLSLLLDHVEGRAGESVADPYYLADAAFDETWADAVAAALALVRKFG